MMYKHRNPGPMAFCVGLLVLAGCTAQPARTASQAPVPPLQPDMARVWVPRQPSAPGGTDHPRTSR